MWPFGVSEKNISQGMGLIKGVGGFIDGLSFTDQEKAGNDQALSELVFRFAKMSQDESSVKSITRRIIAWLVIGGNIFLTMYYVAVCTAAVFWTTYSDGLTVLAGQVLEGLKYWATATTTIVFFYFGYYAVSNVVEKWKTSRPPKPKPNKKNKLAIEDDGETAY